MAQKMKLTWIRLALLVVAVVMIVIGVMQGEPSVVLTKAAAICLECIGIG